MRRLFLLVMFLILSTTASMAQVDKAYMGEHEMEKGWVDIPVTAFVETDCITIGNESYPYRVVKEHIIDDYTMLYEIAVQVTKISVEGVMIFNKGRLVVLGFDNKNYIERN